MSTRDRWLTTGLAVLAEEGEPGVRVDRIAARLGLTKGSFHHHFRGADDFRRALLERHEQNRTAVLESLADASRSLPPDQALSALPDRMAELFDVPLDRAVRAWSSRDQAARAVQERLDAAQLALLQELWNRLLDDERRARAAALIPHLMTIGLGMAHPPLTADEMRATFDLLAELVPSVRRR